jgi:hypothetical protein
VVFATRSLDRRPIGAGHRQRFWPSGPRRFMATANSEFTIAPEQPECTRKFSSHCTQCRIASAACHAKLAHWQVPLFSRVLGGGTSAGSPSGLPHLGSRAWVAALRAAHPRVLQAYGTHGSFQCVRGFSTPRLSATSRWNTWLMGMDSMLIVSRAACLPREVWNDGLVNAVY